MALKCFNSWRLFLHVYGAGIHLPMFVSPSGVCLGKGDTKRSDFRMLDVQTATAGLPESLIYCTPENRQVSGKKRLAKSR